MNIIEAFKTEKNCQTTQVPIWSIHANCSVDRFYELLKAMIAREDVCRDDWEVVKEKKTKIHEFRFGYDSSWPAIGGKEILPGTKIKQTWEWGE